MRVLWWNCFAGIAGDMALGSLVDAGADPEVIVAGLGALGIAGWEVTFEPVLRAGIAATRARVEVAQRVPSRRWSEIRGLIEGASSLPANARARSLAVFSRLAEVEARLHRQTVDSVHFHEVGGVDAIVDIVGTCLALDQLGVQKITSSPVATGVGVVRAAHGELPNPAPAVVGLLVGAPTRGVDLPYELTTPTGAALVTTMAKSWGPMPAMVIEASGFGAGTRDTSGLPNVTQAVLGRANQPAMPGDGQPVFLLEANVDDLSGELVAHSVEALLAAGAHDAWITPILMKKGRPAFTISALVDPALVAAVREVMVAETGTLGTRGQTLERWPLARAFTEVSVGGHPVRVKIAHNRVKAEYDDVVAAAAALGMPAREVAQRAEAQARSPEEGD